MHFDKCSVQDHVLYTKKGGALTKIMHSVPRGELSGMWCAELYEQSSRKLNGEKDEGFYDGNLVSALKKSTIARFFWFTFYSDASEGMFHQIIPSS